MNILYIPRSEIERVAAAPLESNDRLALVADMARLNALAAVKRAGSGHLGSSFSSLDIVAWLYYSVMNTMAVGLDSPDRDVYFSSKGHDAPGQYAVLYGAGFLDKPMLINLRKISGACGHPEVAIPGIEANSGSLGMGISKGKGMALAKRMSGRGGRVFVMTGDGELQEGQIYESLQAAAHQRVGGLTVIVDHNKVQSDKEVAVISDLGDLEARFKSFGWRTARCNGHDFAALDQALAEVSREADRPGIIIADTIKGRGVSFMEHPRALVDGGGLYRWHSGAPDDDNYLAGCAELVARINDRLTAAGLAPVELEDITPDMGQPSGVSDEYVAEAFGRKLVELAEEWPDLVVIDADLAADCRIRRFEETHPDRFVENGIAEQDMVSAAGGLALAGYLPVVNSFASFLASRANEQIYTNATENTKIIYACHYAGLIPAGPGHSHQSVRDISLFGALPNVTMIQPSGAAEMEAAVEYCVTEARENCMLRISIGPSPRRIALPEGYRFSPGRGCSLTEGSDALLLAYGPVMLHEALTAAEILTDRGFGLQVVNIPWLNRLDNDWFARLVEPHRAVFVLEDHSPTGGLADFLTAQAATAGLLSGKAFRKFGVEGHPAWGTPGEVLRRHGLDGETLSRRIEELTGRGK